MRAIGAVAVSLALTSCASHTGEGNYQIAKQAATGFPGLGNLKAEALEEGNEYCTKQGREFVLIRTSETQPPYLLGNYPRAEIEFRCSP
jgi:hypothetical protein